MRGKTAVANGERSAELFREVVLPHLADALSLARWLTGNAHDAEDVVQEACLKAHAGIGSYQGGNARAWLLAIVRNASYTWLARNRSRTLVGVGDIGDLEDLAPPSNPAAGEGNPEAALIARADSAVLRAALEHPEAIKELLASHQPIDLLRAHPADWDAAALDAALRPLTPRLYSIASSAQAVGEEVHLTVAVVDYHAHGEAHLGAASRWIAEAEEEATLDVFIEPNERFRLPADGTRDVIMIGPGTGVAPFRAFVQERQQAGASGRNWLVFGNRHAGDDFLYQLEWQQALKDGALHRLDVAFSRDQPQKRYVQHVLRERGAKLYDWLAGGAHLYVCGDAAQMAKDVHAALAEIVATHGGKTPETAQAWLSELLQDGRYARDVY